MVRKVIGTERRQIVPCVVRETPGRDRTLTFVASSEAVAMDGDIIKADGWDLETRYADNPQFLWSHDSRSLPVGKGVEWRKTDGTLEIDVEFAGPEQANEFADQVYLMYLTGFLRAVSVGFQIRAYENPDEDDRKALGLGPWGVVVTKAELLELSAVVVGSDPQALIKDGQVPREMQDAVLAMRAATPIDVRGPWDHVLEQLPGEWSVDDEATRVDPGNGSDLFDLINEVRAVVREEVRAAVEDLRAGEPAEPPPPEGSERDPDDFYGLNDNLRRLSFNP